MRLDGATTSEVRAALKDALGAKAPFILAVPLGSLEQHGPHLPLDTDARIAVALAASLDDRLAGVGVAVSPPLAFGASGEHAGFEGTLSIGTAVLTEVLVELVRSADAFDGVVLVSGHGGNADAMAGSVARLRAEGRRVTAWQPVLTGDRRDAHAGYAETSLMLAIAPDSVRIDLAEVGETRPLSEIWASLSKGGVASVSSNGVLGDPRGANPEAGRALLAEMSDALGAHVADFASGLARARPVPGSAA